MGTTTDINIERVFDITLSPFAPHIAEELWERIQGKKVSKEIDSSVAYATWPVYDEQYMVAESFTYAIQVNGKVRGTLQLSASEAEDKSFVLEKAKKEPTVAKYLAEGNVVKEIFVPRKIINFVVK